MNRKILVPLIATALVTGSTIAGVAFGQVYPAKPIRIVVGFAPGATDDRLAREISARLQETWGQAAIVDNRPGAGSLVAVDHVAKSPPDGYTLMLASNAIAINPALYAKMPYDTVNDLAPITLLGSVTNVIVSLPSFPAKTMQEVVALARAKPGQVTFGSGGVGTSPHLALELVKSIAKVDMVHVPYKGVPAVVQGMLAGEVNLGVSSLPSAGIPDLVKTGRLRGLALTGTKRAKSAPEIPTMAESGFPGFDVVIWFALLAPAGTPQDVVAKLNKEVIRILSLPDLRERLAASDFEIATSTPAQLMAYIKAEMAQWANVVKVAGVTIN